MPCVVTVFKCNVLVNVRKAVGKKLPQELLRRRIQCSQTLARACDWSCVISDLPFTISSWPCFTQCHNKNGPRTIFLELSWHHTIASPAIWPSKSHRAVSWNNSWNKLTDSALSTRLMRRQRRFCGVLLLGLLALAPASLGPKRSLQQLGKWTNQAGAQESKEPSTSDGQNVWVNEIVL